MRRPLPLTSPDNPRLKHVVHLRKNRDRRAESVFVAEGRREIGRALEAGLSLRQFFYVPSLAGSWDRLLEEFRRRLLTAAPRQVVALRIFGSRARGTSNEWSDLDLAVEPVPGADLRALQRTAVDAAWDAMEATHLERLMLAPVVLPMDGAGLAGVVAREGRLVWNAREGA